MRRADLVQKLTVLGPLPKKIKGAGPKERIPENKEKSLRFLWLVTVFNQKNDFS